MGASPNNEVTQEKKEKVTKWRVQVKYIYNTHKMNSVLEGLNAPTESEVLRVLYNKHGRNSTFSDIDIWNKSQYQE